MRWPWQRDPRPTPAETLAERMRAIRARDARWRSEVARARRIAPSDPVAAREILDRVEAECNEVLRELGVPR